MERLQRMLAAGGMGGGAGGGAPSDTPQVDTAEQIYISSLALLKMLKHGNDRRCRWRPCDYRFMSKRTGLLSVSAQDGLACLWRSWASC